MWKRVVLSCLGAFSLTLFAGEPADMPAGAEPYCAPVADPLEPVNRAFESFNAGLNHYAVYPVSKCYRFIVPKFARKGISNFTSNLAYPLRLTNNCLQGNWTGACNETKRFLVNTTAGFLGLMDVAGEELEIMPSDEDFGQTFGIYGIGAGCYLHLPVVGPTTLRDGIGGLVGLPFVIGTWVFPSQVGIPISACGALNRIFESSPAYREYFLTNYDSYPLTRAATIVSQEARIRNFNFEPVKSDPEESLGLLKFNPQDSEFFDKSHTGYVRLEDAKYDIPYSYWQPKKGDNNRLMVILPGLGGHRLGSGVCALAELYRNAGWTVISFSSTMHPEVFRGFSEQRFPGDFPRDSADMYAAIEDAASNVGKKTGHTYDKCTLLGYSLGGINSLFIAREKRDFQIERIIAINPPRRPLYALEKIDQYFAIAEQWGDDSQARARLMLQRIAGVLLGDKSAVSADFPVTREESCFLIGLSMRLTLVDALSSFLKDGIPMPDISEKPELSEKLGYSWGKYVRDNVWPEYQRRMGNSLDFDEFCSRLSIDAVGDIISQDERVYVLHNENDFLMTADDIEWYRKKLGSRGIIMPRGSHLGNLWLPEYKSLLLRIAQ